MLPHSTSRDSLLESLSGKQIKMNRSLKYSIIFMLIDFIFFFTFETIDAFYLEFFPRIFHILIWIAKVILNITNAVFILISVKYWKSKNLLFLSFT
jgi:hypothetical protein